MLVDDRCQYEMEYFMSQCESPKIRLLWEIFYKTEIRDVELLEERIYQYGSMVNAQDYFGRELFVGMVSLLKHLKDKK